MSVLLFVCFLFLILLQGCHQPSSSMDENEFKNYVNSDSTVDSTSRADLNSRADSNSSVNSSTSIAQPDAQQPVTLVNAAF